MRLQRSLLRHNNETLNLLGGSRRDNNATTTTNSADQGPRTGVVITMSQPLLAKASGATVGKLSANSIRTLPQLVVRQSPNYLLVQLNAGRPGSLQLFRAVKRSETAAAAAAALLSTRMSKHHDFCQSKLGCALCHFEYKSRPIDNINILPSKLLHQPVRFPNLRTRSAIHV